MSSASIADIFDAAGTPVNTTTTEEPEPLVKMIDDGVAYGFQCAEVVEDNTLTDVPMTFFLDISFPMGSEHVAITYLQEHIIASVADYYGVSNGERCDDPTLGQSTWLVQILSKTTDWTRETLFDTCRQLTNDSAIRDCFVYQAIITGSILDGTMDDVMDFIVKMLQDDALTSNTPYAVQFLGVPEGDPFAGDSNRDNLGGGIASGGPASVAQSQTAQAPPEQQTLTIVGALLMTAFGFAFLGMGLVLWRRRQDWLRRRDVQLAGLDLDREKNHPTHPEEDEEEYGEAQLQKDLYGDDMDDHGSHVELDSKGRVRHHGDPDDRITFDLGTSFKDQLMGVYGNSASHQKNQRGSRNSSYRFGPRGMAGVGTTSGAYAMSDGASDVSDADSWAQTDGTIGSLEHVNLDPITAEV